jgi:hypothetical protein
MSGGGGRVFDRLGINEQCGRQWWLATALASEQHQLLIDRLPGAILSPFGKIPVNSLLGREVVFGQGTPFDALTADLEDGIEQLDQWPFGTAPYLKAGFYYFELWLGNTI